MTEKYSFMPYNEILKYESEAEKLKVSEIARGKTSKTGFMEIYKEYGSNLPEFWEKKRNSFIARTLAAYKKKPSYRRKLSLIFWGFDPDK